MDTWTYGAATYLQYPGMWVCLGFGGLTLTPQFV